MKYKYLPLSLVFSSLLAGCGGSSGGKEEPKQQESTNSAPVAVIDTSSTLNGESVAISVLENDTDSDGDALTVAQILTQPTHGTATISNNEVLYTPLDANFAGKDSFSYQITDGEKTSQASVELTLYQQLTLQGQVVDKPIANADVSLTVNGETFETQADSNGFYQLDVKTSDITDMLLLKAIGTANDQQHVELVNLFGSFESVMLASGEDRIFSYEQGNNANITHLSTAHYLLAEEQNAEDPITTQETYDSFSAQISPKELLDTASFIKLLVDNDNYTIAEGTSLTLLNSGEVKEAINAYLVSIAAMDTQGNLTEQYEADFTQAKNDSISSTDLAFTEQELIEQPLFTFSAYRKKLMPLYADKTLILNSDHQGKSIVANNNDIREASVEWKIEQGKLVFDFAEDSVLRYAIDLSFNIDSGMAEIANKWGEDIAIAIRDAYYEDKINSFIIVKKYPLKRTVSKLANDKAGVLAYISGVDVEELEIPEAVEWESDTLIYEKPIDGALKIVNGTNDEFSLLSSEQLVGEWSVPSLYASEEISGSILNHEYLTISGATATAKHTGKSYVVERLENSLVLSSSTEKVTYTPIMSDGNRYLTFVQQWENGELIFQGTGSVVKVQDDAELFFENMITELPKVYQPMITVMNHGSESVYENDLMNIDYLYAYQFDANNTVKRAIRSAHLIDGPDNYFHIGTEWTWSRTDNQIKMGYESDFDLRYRFWDVLAYVPESNSALVHEYSLYGYDEDNNGEISEDEIENLIYPRINFIKLEDLSLWKAAWQNTVNKGL